MSALGATLLRPQRFDRSYPVGGLRMADTVAELASSLVRDFLTGGSAQEKIKTGMQAALQELGQTIAQRQRNAGGKINDWFKPILDTVKAGTQAAGNANDAESTVTVLSALLNLLAGALSHATADEIAAKINSLCDIVETDLGLNGDLFSGLVRQMIDRLVEELSQDFLAGNNSQDAKNNFAIGSKISALKLFMLQELEKINLQIDRRQIVADFALELKKRDWDSLIGKIGEVANGASSAAAGASSLFSLSADVSVGNRSARVASRKKASRDAANPVQMSWYASWFFGSRFDSSFVTVKNRMKLDEQELPGKISYKNHSPAFMEGWAHVTSGLADVLEGATHAWSLERGDYFHNLAHLLLQGGKGIVTFAAHDHEGEDWVKAFKWLDNLFFENGAALLATFGASFEQWPGTWNSWFKGNFAVDFAEWYLYNIWHNTGKDFMLSLLTLSNSDLQNHPDSQNYQKDEGFIYAFTEIAFWLSTLIPRIGDKKHYGFPFSDDTGGWAKLVLIAIFGSWGSAYLAAWAGWAVAGAISGKNSDQTWASDKGILWLKILLRYTPVQWLMYYYLMWDGKTDDGRFGLDGSGNEVILPGYPRPATSPYKLPYEKGKLLQCVQGNHGLWSHNPQTQQIYGIDFNHNHRDKTLAMRGGTVVDYRDNIADHTRPNDDWNFVTIRHDDPTEPALPDAEHDRDHTAAPVTTYGIYGHGAYYGVRHAFATRGIDTAGIIGATVKRGDLVMLSGDTGISQYNHLHVMVSPNSSGFPTVPFVFKEVTNLVGRDGLPKSHNYYESDNEEPARIAESQYQPYQQQGKIVSAGPNYVDLDATAVTDIGYYIGAHILVKSEPVPGRFVFHYKKIVRYQGNLRRAYIQGNWDAGLPPGANSEYTIGAMPIQEDTDRFWKFFAFQADTDASGNSPDFPGGKTPYHLV